jgi:hypothetical protein
LATILTNDASNGTISLDLGRLSGVIIRLKCVLTGVDYYGQTQIKHKLMALLTEALLLLSSSSNSDVDCSRSSA